MLSLLLVWMPPWLSMTMLPLYVVSAPSASSPLLTVLLSRMLPW